MPKLSVLAAILALFMGPATAQTDYPSRSIALIVPFAAGGPTDTVARLSAKA
jgi:tripartite-type tricarboxylate transporter receptor subunit TctC